MSGKSRYVLFLVNTLLATTLHAAPQYSLTILNALVEDGYAIAYAINNRGDIAGTANNAVGGDSAVVWSGDSIRALPGADTRFGNSAYAINDAGEVAGEVNYSFEHSPAVRWRGDSVVELQDRGQYSVVNAINNHGQVVGHSNTSSGDYAKATVWNEIQPAVLTTPDAGSSAATAINDYGVIAGHTWLAGRDLATVWQDGSARTLITPDSFSSMANSINNHGQVAGLLFSQDGTFQTQPALWHGENLTVLSHDGLRGNAKAINDHGAVVGTVETGYHERHASLWLAGEYFRLNELLNAASAGAGWELWEAIDINEHGQIIGTAFNPADGSIRPYLLTPVPEPETLALMLAGLGAMVWRRRGLALHVQSRRG